MVPNSPTNEANIPLLLPDKSVGKQHESETENDEHMCMRGTIPQHIDDHFSKVEDLAGTGECDALGG